MTINEFRAIYDKTEPTDFEIDIITDVLKRCGRGESENVKIWMDFQKKRLRLLSAALENAAGKAINLKKYQRAFDLAKEEVEARRGSENEKQPFCSWLCMIERAVGFEINGIRDISDLIEFTKIVNAEQEYLKNKQNGSKHNTHR